MFLDRSAFEKMSFLERVGHRLALANKVDIRAKGRRTPRGTIAATAQVGPSFSPARKEPRSEGRGGDGRMGLKSAPGTKPGPHTVLQVD